jgi:hypothetical protein
MEGERRVYLSGPESIEIPPEFRLCPIEVIILLIDRSVDASRHSGDFAEAVFDSREGELFVRERQPEYNPQGNTRLNISHSIDNVTDGLTAGGSMISLVVVPESTKVTIEVPAEFINKKLHVDIREEGGAETAESQATAPDAEALSRTEAFYATLKRDLRGPRFNREEANER